MKSVVRQFQAVTIGLCLSMLFSISAFAAQYYPWFTVPGNVNPILRFYYHNSAGEVVYKNFTRSDGNYYYLSKPADFVQDSYTPRTRVIFNGGTAAYLGFTLKNSNFTIADPEPLVLPNSLNKVAVSAITSYYSTSKIYSAQTNYIDNSNSGSTVAIANMLTYMPNGTDGHVAITANSFPLYCRIDGYRGQFNYAGITSDGSYNATTINSNKANTAIELTGELSEDVQLLGTEVNTLSNDIDELESTLIDALSTLNGQIGWIRRNLTYNDALLPVGSRWTDSSGVDRPYMSYERKTFSIENEKVKITKTSYCGTFAGILYRKINEFFDYFQTLFDVIWEWWYPLKSSTPQYWNVYNTDTDSTELVNPSTVTYYITWYLGQLFLMNNEDTPLGDLQDSVDDIKDQLTTVESQEQSIITSIRSGIDSFAPDLTEIGSFKALSWCSNYLQQIYVNLGVYGTVILIGLLLGVCMQFIGYFRYK